MVYLMAFIYVIIIWVICGELYYYFINKKYNKYKKDNIEIIVKRIDVYMESIPIMIAVIMIIYIIGYCFS